MTENLVSYPHIEMMYQIIGLHYDPNTSIRRNKEKVMDELGISNGTNVAREEMFQVRENDAEIARLKDYIIQEVRNERYLSLLIMREKWGSLGGCPVVYLADRNDIKNKLFFNGTKLVELKSQEGELLAIRNESQINTYSRHRSRLATISGFDNYEGERKTRLGGGFRLQADKVIIEDGELDVILSGVFSFDDRGSRVLALASDEDLAVPRFSGTYRLVYRDGAVFMADEVELTLGQVIESRRADSVCNAVVKSLLKQDGKAITDLFKLMFSVSPSLQMHQLEGIFSLTNEAVSAEVIDFDGIDNLDAARLHTGEELLPELKPAERILRSHLISCGFLVSDPIALRSLYLMRQTVENVKNVVIKTDLLSEEIKYSVIKHLSNPREIFERCLTGPVKLAKLLRALGLKWTGTEISGIERCVYDGHILTLVSVEGFELAYWENNGRLINTDKIKELVEELSSLTQRQIVKAHLSYIHEGD